MPGQHLLLLNVGVEAEFERSVPIHPPASIPSATDTQTGYGFWWPHGHHR